MTRKSETDILWGIILALFTMAHAAMELPKFNQMKLLYPGYYLNDGKYRDSDIIKLIGGNHGTIHLHNTAAIRMSWMFNRYGGRHDIGTEPISLTNRGQDSYTGKDLKQYIFRNTAFGPFLAQKYGNPIIAQPNRKDHTKTMLPFQGKQGIARFVTYKRHHASGHIALWDCDHFHQSRDWTSELHIISVEFWETPDSICPSKLNTALPKPKMMKVDPSKVKLIPRHNFGNEYYHREGSHGKRHKRTKRLSEQLWMQ